ncbi:type VII secretion protein EssA [Listeria weihenstephanensis]|uniref:Type VII secretion protein EssA n=1 Tax=Listeria weihenstephanensis TaxID=1006155 RepID=A0A841Z8X4_9LIST|nr:type VII secretion protein EssA [Listeria weihenstephanensis]MBC1501755.1 type VII secretion protein EssA [Listeria weihenstephanensis]
MNKKMGRFLVSVCVVIGIVFIVPVSALAAKDEDSYLGDDGKMEIQADRAGKTDKEKLGEAETQETEAEKRGLNLFSKANEEQDAKIKAYKEKELADLKASLFADNNEKVDTAKATRESLFSEDYVVPTAMDASADDSEKDSTTIWWVLGGVAVLVCGLLYVIVRKVWE